MRLQVGVQNGPNPQTMHWDWSEPLTVAQLLDRMAYLVNAGSWREENKWPNAVKVRVAE